ncbi:putative 1-phosphatidylinositol-4-phosphate 5-kinase [Helianthus anomalus]
MRGCRFLEAGLQDMDRVLAGRFKVGVIWTWELGVEERESTSTMYDIWIKTWPSLFFCHYS